MRCSNSEQVIMLMLRNRAQRRYQNHLYDAPIVPPLGGDEAHPDGHLQPVHELDGAGPAAGPGAPAPGGCLGAAFLTSGCLGASFPRMRRGARPGF